MFALWYLWPTSDDLEGVLASIPEGIVIHLFKVLMFEWFQKGNSQGWYWPGVVCHAYNPVQYRGRGRLKQEGLQTSGQPGPLCYETSQTSEMELEGR